MTDICLPPHRLEALLTEINRHRALTDEETDLLEAIITRGHPSSAIRFKWTPALERALLRAYSRPSGVRAFAERHGITQQAAYDKLCKLRKAKSQRAEKCAKVRV
jgi:hypothetical protein